MSIYVEGIQKQERQILSLIELLVLGYEQQRGATPCHAMTQCDEKRTKKRTKNPINLMYLEMTSLVHDLYKERRNKGDK